MTGVSGFFSPFSVDGGFGFLVEVDLGLGFAEGLVAGCFFGPSLGGFRGLSASPAPFFASASGCDALLPAGSDLVLDGPVVDAESWLASAGGLPTDFFDLGFLRVLDGLRNGALS